VPTVDVKSQDRPTNVFERRPPGGSGGGSGAGAPDALSLTEPTVVAMPDPRLLVVTEPTLVALPDPRLLTYSDATPAEPTVMAQPRRRAKGSADPGDELGAKTEPFSLAESMAVLDARRDARDGAKRKGKREAANGSVSLGKYQLLRPLSSGSTSHVFLARHDSDTGSARHLAVKTLRRQHVYDAAHVGAFHDEARLFGALHHRSLAQVLDVALSSDGTHYLAMEYLHGETLTTMMQKARADEVGLPLDFSLTAVTSAASALQHVQERLGGDARWQNLPCRLLTPSSLTAVYDGMVKITSFGCSKAAVRAALGTGEIGKLKLGYLTPEHVQGKQTDARSDVFSLGVILYELTTLVNPFAAKTLAELKARVMRGEPTLPSQVVPGYPIELEQIVMIALSKSPEQRFQDCGALGNALIEAANTLGMVIGPNAIRGALGKLFGGKIEPWLELASETPMPVTTVHPDAALPTAQMPAAQMQAVLTDPAMGGIPQRSRRATPSGAVSANVVGRVSAAMHAQSMPAVDAGTTMPSMPPQMSSPTSAQMPAQMPASAQRAPLNPAAMPIATTGSPGRRATPPTMPPPLTQAARPAPSIPLPAVPRRAVPPTMPPPLPQAPRPGQPAPSVPQPAMAPTMVSAPTPELLAASAMSAPPGGAAVAMPSARPALSSAASPPPTRGVLVPVPVTPAPSLSTASARPPSVNDDAGRVGPSLMPTLRGHEGSRARVAARSRGSDLISSDELHRIVADAHASAWKEAPSRMAAAQGTAPPQGAAMPARVGKSPRRHTAMNAEAEAEAPWSGLAAPVPSAMAVSRSGAPAPAAEMPGPASHAPRLSWLRRGFELLSVLAALALLAASQPAMVPVLDSLGLETQWGEAKPAVPTALPTATPAAAPMDPAAATTDPAAATTDPAAATTTPATATADPGTPPAPPPVPAPAMYKLEIKSEPADAVVLLDGERLGRTPISIIRPMGDGVAVLRLRHRGYQTRKLEIQRNQDLTLEIKLRPAPPKTSDTSDVGEVGDPSGAAPVVDLGTPQ
jgi:eukaryotic-like serine/threonine-protein kinase